MFFLLLNQGNFLLITVSHRCKITDLQSSFKLLKFKEKFFCRTGWMMILFFQSLGTANRKNCFFLQNIIHNNILSCTCRLPFWCDWHLTLCAKLPLCLLCGNRVFSVSTGKQIRHLCLVGAGDGLMRSMVITVFHLSSRCYCGIV